MPDKTTTLLHVEKKSFDAVPNADVELKNLIGKLHQKFGDRLPGLRAEVLESLSGYYDRLQQPEI